MTDLDVEMVRDAIRAYRDEHGKRFRPGDLSNFAELIYHLAYHPDLFLRSFDPFEAHAATAMLVLGFPRGKLPNAAERADLMGALCAFEPVPCICMADMLHLVLKYGCCTGHWPESMRALSAMHLPFVEQANDCLEQQAIAFPKKYCAQTGRLDPETRDILSPAHTADKLAHILTHPETPLHLGQNEMLTITCEPNVTKIVLPWLDDAVEVYAGGKYVFTVRCDVTVRGPNGTYRVPAGSKIVVTASDDWTRIELRISETPLRYLAVVQLDLKESALVAGPAELSIWECTCGNAQCAQRHRLAAWNHREWPLISFVATAVKGPGAEGRTVNNLYVNSFVTGIYFPRLARGL